MEKMEEIKGDEPAERSGAGSIGCVSRQSRMEPEMEDLMLTHPTDIGFTGVQPMCCNLAIFEDRVDGRL